MNVCFSFVIHGWIKKYTLSPSRDKVQNTLRYHSRLPPPHGNDRSSPAQQADGVTAVTRPRLLISAGGSKVIFAFRPSPPYTNRRLSARDDKCVLIFGHSLYAVSVAPFFLFVKGFLKFLCIFMKNKGGGMCAALMRVSTLTAANLCFQAQRSVSR